MADAAPASSLTIATTFVGLLLGGLAAHRYFGKDVSVIGLVPMLVVGGLVGKAVGDAWPASHTITAGAANPP
jgi:hypothetical protein